MTATAPAQASGTTARSRTATLALAAAGVTVVLWASAFIGIRAVGHYYSPGAMTLARQTVGSIVLTALVLIQARRGVRLVLPRGKTLAYVVAYGVLWFGLYTICVNASEQHLDAGTSALLVAVGPVLIAVLAGLFLGEGFPRGLVVGIVIAFGGVITIAAATSTGQHDATGVFLALAAAGLYAVGVLLQKQALRGTQPLPATWLGCLVGAVVCLPYGPAFVHEMATAPVGATAGIVYLGVFPTATAFLTWSYALTYTSAGRLASSTYVVPALAVLLSWLLLAEVPAPLAFLGGALCLVGVAVTRLPERFTRLPRRSR